MSRSYTHEGMVRYIPYIISTGYAGGCGAALQRYRLALHVRWERTMRGGRTSERDST